ncbi:hypothetical protein Stok01_02991 [Sulfurisphaera tokodaii]
MRGHISSVCPPLWASPHFINSFKLRLKTLPRLKRRGLPRVLSFISIPKSLNCNILLNSGSCGISFVTLTEIKSIPISLRKVFSPAVTAVDISENFLYTSTSFTLLRTWLTSWSIIGLI